MFDHETVQVEDEPKAPKKYGKFQTIVVDGKNITREKLEEISQAYEKENHKKLALSFPGNDTSSAFPPSKQYEGNQRYGWSGLAIPYQLKPKIENEIIVTPVPASFMQAANKNNIEEQHKIIEHYIAGLYFQVGLGNGIHVPVRPITEGSEKAKEGFTHQKHDESEKDKYALKSGQEYAWGANTDTGKFCLNHGEFFEVEINRLNEFMFKLNEAKLLTEQEQIIKDLSTNFPQYYKAFQQAVDNPEQEWYGAYQAPAQEKEKVITQDKEPQEEHAEEQETIDADTKPVLKRVDSIEMFKTIREMISDIADEDSQEKQQLIQFLDKKIEQSEETLASNAKPNAPDRWALEGMEYMKGFKSDNHFGITNLFSDQETQALASYKDINFRKNSGSEGRHITPIAWAENVVRNALRPGMTLEEAESVLLGLVEPFIDNDKFKGEIQKLFENYKRQDAVTNWEHIQRLVQILGIIYNDKSTMVSWFDKDGVVGRDREKAFIAPAPFSGAKFVHEKEGSLTNAYKSAFDAYELLTQVQPGDTLEQHAKDISNLSNAKKKGALEARVTKIASEPDSHKQKLTPAEIKQIAYMIYGSFDFPPIDLSDENIPAEENASGRHRKEPIERLNSLALSHMKLFFLQYPGLAEDCGRAITQQFINFVVNGVTKQDLEDITDKKTVTTIGKKNDINDFILTGFNQQYNKIKEQDLERAVLNGLFASHVLDDEYSYMFVVKDEEAYQALLPNVPDRSIIIVGENYNYQAFLINKKLENWENEIRTLEIFTDEPITDFNETGELQPTERNQALFAYLINGFATNAEFTNFIYNPEVEQQVEEEHEFSFEVELFLYINELYRDKKTVIDEVTSRLFPKELLDDLEIQLQEQAAEEEDESMVLEHPLRTLQEKDEQRVRSFKENNQAIQSEIIEKFILANLNINKLEEEDYDFAVDAFNDSGLDSSPSQEWQVETQGLTDEVPVEEESQEEIMQENTSLERATQTTTEVQSERKLKRKLTEEVLEQPSENSPVGSPINVSEEHTISRTNSSAERPTKQTKLLPVEQAIHKLDDKIAKFFQEILDLSPYVSEEGDVETWFNDKLKNIKIEISAEIRRINKVHSDIITETNQQKISELTSNFDKQATVVAQQVEKYKPEPVQNNVLNNSL